MKRDFVMDGVIRGLRASGYQVKRGEDGAWIVRSKPKVTVDIETQAIRRDAVERVKRAGIFEPPKFASGGIVGESPIDTARKVLEEERASPYGAPSSFDEPKFSYPRAPLPPRINPRGARFQFKPRGSTVWHDLGEGELKIVDDPTPKFVTSPARVVFPMLRKPDGKGFEPGPARFRVPLNIGDGGWTYDAPADKFDPAKAEAWLSAHLSMLADYNEAEAVRGDIYKAFAAIKRPPPVWVTAEWAARYDAWKSFFAHNDALTPAQRRAAMDLLFAKTDKLRDKGMSKSVGNALRPQHWEASKRYRQSFREVRRAILDTSDFEA